MKRDADGVVMWEEGRPAIERTYAARKAALEEDEKHRPLNVEAIINRMVRGDLIASWVLAVVLVVCCALVVFVVLRAAWLWWTGGG